LYSSSGIIKVFETRIIWAGHVACMEEMRTRYKKILIRNPEMLRPKLLVFWLQLKPYTFYL
jgi:hypothetical protein